AGVRAGLKVCDPPSGAAFAKAQADVADFGRMRILGSAENEFVFFQDEYEAGIETSNGGREVNNAVEDFAERTGGGHTTADFVKDAERGIPVFLFEEFGRAFRGFFDEKAHARMGCFHIRLEAERADALGSGRADGCDDETLETAANFVLDFQAGC